jgi:NAD+ kinase
MLFDRSLVMAQEETVELEVLGHRVVALTLDGRSVATLDEGDTVRIRPAPEPVNFVRFGHRRFHQILKAKFGLADR